MAEMDGPHWRFSLAVYGRAGVPPACLKLQDNLGLDVNMLLLALFFVMLNLLVDIAQAAIDPRIKRG
jgi:uncharacterized protein (TIGR02444 family)